MPKKPTIADLQQTVQDLTEALQRERADAQNVRKQAEQDKAGLADLHKAQVVKQLLPIVDNLERALKHVPKDLAGHDYIAGVSAVVKQFEQTLAKLGVNPIGQVGELFDPHLHEAISADGEGSQESIGEVLQTGYQLGDQIIRHAMVRVRRG